MVGSKYLIIIGLTISNLPIAAMQALARKQEEVNTARNKIIFKLTDTNKDMARLSETINNLVTTVEEQGTEEQRINVDEIPLSAANITNKALAKILKDLPSILDLHSPHGANTYESVRRLSFETRRDRAGKRARGLQIPKYSPKDFADALDAFRAAEYLMIPELMEIYGRDIAKMLLSPEGLAALSRDATILNKFSVELEAIVVNDIPEMYRTLAGHTGEIFSAVFSPNGSKVVTASGDRTAKIWNAATGICEQTLTSHPNQVRSAEFSPDGSRVVTISSDTAKIWNAVTGICEQTLTTKDGFVHSAEFSPDGSKVVTASNDSTKIWNAATGICERTFTGHTPAPFSAVYSAKFSSNGSKVVTASGASGDRTAKIWNAATGICEQTLTSHPNQVRSAEFSPDGSRVVTISSDTAKIWNAATGICEHTLTGHTYGVNSAVFSPDGSKIVTADNDNMAKIWNAVTGICERTLTGHTREVKSAEFSPDGSKIVTASYDKTAKIWNAAKGICEQTLTGHTGWVNSAEFSPDGSKVVTASYDTAKIWNAATGSCERTLIDYTLSVNHDKTAKIWNPISLLGVNDFDAKLFVHVLHWAHENNRRITDTAWAPRVIKAIEWDTMNPDDATMLKSWVRAVGMQVQ